MLNLRFIVHQSKLVEKARALNSRQNKAVWMRSLFNEVSFIGGMDIIFLSFHEIQVFCQTPSILISSFIHNSCSIWRGTQEFTQAIDRMFAISRDAPSRMHNQMICWSIREFILAILYTNAHSVKQIFDFKLSWENIIGCTMSRLKKTTKHSQFNEFIHRYEDVHKIDSMRRQKKIRRKFKFIIFLIHAGLLLKFMEINFLLRKWKNANERH